MLIESPQQSRLFVNVIRGRWAALLKQLERVMICILSRKVTYACKPNQIGFHAFVEGGHADKQCNSAFEFIFHRSYQYTQTHVHRTAQTDKEHRFIYEALFFPSEQNKRHRAWEMRFEVTSEKDQSVIIYNGVAHPSQKSYLGCDASRCFCTETWLMTWIEVRSTISYFLTAVKLM